MHESLEDALKQYQAAWTDWCGAVHMDTSNAQPTAVGWKVPDLEAFMEALQMYLSDSPQVHIADVNNRKLASIVLTEALPMGIKVIKLMQRRLGSDDALGLDHVDFTVKDLSEVEVMLKSAHTEYEWQSNDAHKWISARITGGREAKFVDHTVLEVGAKELLETAAGLTA